MELRHLRYFVALTHTLNFTRAAELLHVTQSTLSHQIAQLEQELGAPLFVRASTGLQLTPEGETFLVQARQALDAVDAGVRSIRSPASAGRDPVRIGATPSLTGSLVASAATRMLAGRPGMSFVMLDMTPGEIATALRAGTIDLGVAYPPLDADGLTGERLYVEEMVLVVGAQHPLARRRRIQLADLHGRRMVLPTHHFSIRYLMDECLKAARAEPVVLAEVDSFQATLTLLQVEDVAALLPSTAAPGAPWRCIPIERPFAHRTVTLYRRAGERLSADVKHAHQGLREAARRQ